MFRMDLKLNLVVFLDHHITNNQLNFLEINIKLIMLLKINSKNILSTLNILFFIINLI